MTLAKYQQKRNFAVTSEPQGNEHKGNVRRGKGSRFYIQKHDASHLHYDFRLELDGVLKSWAVPHGPSLDPSQKRLAVEVEDHPLEYGTFEGTIPAGQYGGGTVLLWDRGTWKPVGDPTAGYRNGKLVFELDGEKLHGGWSLVRMHSKPGDKRNNWLLIKQKDSQAVPTSESDILEVQPQSVSSGRSLDEIAGKVSARSASRKPSAPTKTTTKPAADHAVKNGKTGSTKAKKDGARKSPFPKQLEPELATLVKTPPEGDEWLHEVKFDGYRILAYLNRGKVVLRSRNQLDWTHRFPEIAEVLAKLPLKQAVFDGEIVALLPDGTSSFQELQMALTATATSKLKYVIFDVLYSDGYDLRDLSLEERRKKLIELIGSVDLPQLGYSTQLTGSGADALKYHCQRGYEGIVSKLKDEPYKAGRAGDWYKSKCAQTDEFVIGGFTDSPSARKKLGALLLGYHDASGKIIYSGKVGTGFSEPMLEELHGLLTPIEQSDSPFADAGDTRFARGTHWVKPRLVAQIGYTNRTRDGRLRHPVFQGLREDKPAAKVTREVPQEKPASAPRKTQSKSGAGKVRNSNGKAGHSALSTKDFAELERVGLTHPDRIVYPTEGITKLELATYYATISEWILPQIIKRPLSLLRCPEGQGGPSFYQKHAGPGISGEIHQMEITEKHKVGKYLTIDSLAGLLSLIQMGVLEIHPWGARMDDVERPDRMVLDLDPDPEIGWSQVTATARELRERLQKLGLESFVKTTGGKGLHVVVPLTRHGTWEELKGFSKGVADRLVADSPNLYTTNMSKLARRGKIFVDYLRNDRGATAVAAYSTRARVGAPVATPITWDELKSGISPMDFNVRTMPQRLESLSADPWQEMLSVKQSISAKMRRAVGL